MEYDCYIASGWFNENQAADLQNIKNVCEKLNLKYFSPKDEILLTNVASKEQQELAFNGNINAIKNCKFVIVNTRDKDMGTIFEAGASYILNKPIIYYCEGLKGNFNLMLSRSGKAVATNLAELENHLININKDINYYKEYSGLIE
jgi:nucleoside 2-deoxyribosyltransferase